MTTIKHGYSYIDTPFSIETEAVKNSPGTWNSIKVSIFKNGTFIGEYLRNYHSFAKETFYPFLFNETWYALYSPNYTATRVMKLNDDSIEDWCGEDPNSYGFCPVEFYVPKYHKYFRELDYSYIIVNGSEYKTLQDFENENDYTESGYLKFGFLSGCIWGDDSSWKIRYIDFSDLENKKIEITEKFGYHELPNSLSLRECINFNEYEEDNEIIRLVKEERFNLLDN
jgi:hypothetical protein